MSFFKNILEFVNNISLNTLVKNLNMYVLYYYIIINFYGFILVGLDKRKARRRQFRTREVRFFITSFIGGALGVVMGMTVFRHKTQKSSFYKGIPAIFLLNIISLLYLYKYIIF
ncbi:DUF1294 domain-containing protein [Tepidibacter formicigenes]|jgi:uncharacterized membrane protein YsdA (DUF1294 family)|uniref:Uncharacterized membrane protein YsdA, DUF1294 family n=1 Tax=Tepidibacter formicigenes DSM 15518 TaxID=1123349 RepID=A0A1M6MZJ6_9FIRM|nr:DUF1294 domain-containing protein [Tepidibacter formicigenes]SHJ88820.1 Uncharacterized membrane protein YsdA, DUF1294 family [Tepidibacter formicigenes DSM 15518]